MNFNDLLIFIQLQSFDNYETLKSLEDEFKKYGLNYVILNDEKNILKFDDIKIRNFELGFSRNEIIKNIYKEHINNKIKYILHYPCGLKFNINIITNIYNQIKRGFDIVICHKKNENTKIGFFYKLFYRCLSFVKIAQPYSRLFCFNWHVIQNFLINERLNVEPASYIFFQVRLHLKILSLPIDSNIPLYVQKPSSKFGFKQCMKLFYYLLISK